MEMTESLRERYDLITERMKEIQKERTVPEKFQGFFSETASFLLLISELEQLLRTRDWSSVSLEEVQAENRKLYEDILPGHYEKSYANPAYMSELLGEQWGAFLSALYTELRGAIPYAYEGNAPYLTILMELFVEIYTAFAEEEGEPEYEQVKKIFYWYASDYCDVFVADRIKSQIDTSGCFAADLIMGCDWNDERSLYRYGEYVSDNERKTLQFLSSQPADVLQKMADVYTQGYRIGFVNTGKDLSKKKTVDIRYVLGFEPVMKLAMENFQKMGLSSAIYRSGVSVLTRNPQHKIGYYGGSANKQYEYDHRQDQALILDKQYLERKFEVSQYTYEQNKEMAGAYAGPAVMEVFGEKPFVPQKNEAALSLDEKQEKLSLTFQSRTSQMVNQYIKGEERSFTIVAYPIPEIGERFEEIFAETIGINTLDAKVYEKVQQAMIDALDQGNSVHVKGSGDNQTDLTISLYPLHNPKKETKFENCVADVNIPVGEVFTSPVLAGTTGTLHVSKVYLNELQYENLKLEFQDGMIKDYSCTNFATEEENKKYIRENVLHNHETLPMGEFAIGTNTTAYVVAKQYGIEEKMPILIAEKMGPHFAVGDTCYSWEEDNHMYNPDGKEIVAKENEVSALRKEDPQKAYFQCHTDITIPYEELEEIVVNGEGDVKIPIISKGKFVLKGTELLNEPLTVLD